MTIPACAQGYRLGRMYFMSTVKKEFLSKYLSRKRKWGEMLHGACSSNHHVLGGPCSPSPTCTLALGAVAAAHAHPLPAHGATQLLSQLAFQLPTLGHHPAPWRSLVRWPWSLPPALWSLLLLRQSVFETPPASQQSKQFINRKEIGAPEFSV